MAIANLTWNAPQYSGGSVTGYKVEYKKSSDGSWILFNANVSGTSCQITNLDAGTNYDFRVITHCTVGDAGGEILTLATPCVATIINQVYLIQPATQNTSGGNWVASNRPNVDYGTYGTKVYRLNQWNLDGSAINNNFATNQTYSNTFMNNMYRNELDGRMNDVCVWARQAQNSGTFNTALSEWIGFSRTFTVSESKVYYIGCGADNRARIDLDGTTILQNTDDNMEHFQWWHVYPIYLTAGTHTLSMYGWDVGVTGDFGFEIYNNTEAQILSDNFYNYMSLLYSTSSEFGKPFNNGTTIGYSCPPGWQLDMTDGNAMCIKLNETCTDTSWN